MACADCSGDCRQGRECPHRPIADPLDWIDGISQMVRWLLLCLAFVLTVLAAAGFFGI
jgi:hypothetical protein